MRMQLQCKWLRKPHLNGKTFSRTAPHAIRRENARPPQALPLWQVWTRNQIGKIENGGTPPAGILSGYKSHGTRLLPNVPGAVASQSQFPPEADQFFVEV